MVRPVPTSSASSPVSHQTLDGALGFGSPRVADEALSGASESAQGFRFLIADCKREGVGLDRLAVVERDPPATVASVARTALW